MSSFAKRENFVLVNIILNILVTIYGTTRTTRIQDTETRTSHTANTPKAEKSCKEEYPYWHMNKETSQFCDKNKYQPGKTCKSSCGSNITYINGQCFCDQDCIQYGDCCSDFLEFCSKSFTNKTYKLDISLSERRKYECMAINETTFVYLLSTCDVSHYGSSLEDSCKRDHDEDDEIMSQIPAVDPETGTVYKNIDCARCNNVRTPKLWAIQTICERKVLTEKDVHNPDINFIRKILTSKSCFSNFAAPVNAKVRSCIPTEYTCPTCANATLVDLCLTYGLHPVQSPTETNAPIPNLGIVYHNRFCWFCNNPQKIYPRSCRISLIDRDRVPVKIFSFQILVDMSGDNKRNLNVRPSGGIQSVEFELECMAESNCVAVACPDGYTKNSGKCVMTGKLVQTTLTVTKKALYSVKIETLQEILQQTFKPTGYIDSNTTFTTCKNSPSVAKIRFNVSFPQNLPNVLVYGNMTEKYQKFIKGIERIEFHSEVNMTYKVLPSRSDNSEDMKTCGATCKSTCPQFIATSMELYLSMTVIIATISFHI